MVAVLVIIRKALEAEWSVDIETENGIAETDFVTEIYWN